MPRLLENAGPICLLVNPRGRDSGWLLILMNFTLRDELVLQSEGMVDFPIVCDQNCTDERVDNHKSPSGYANIWV